MSGCFGADPAAQAQRAAAAQSYIAVQDPFSPKVSPEKRRRRRVRESDDASCASSDAPEGHLSCASTPVVTQASGAQSPRSTQPPDETCQGRNQPAAAQADDDKEVTTFWGLINDLLYGEPEGSDSAAQCPPASISSGPALKRTDSRDSVGSALAESLALQRANSRDSLKRANSRDSMGSAVSTGTFTAPPI
jgi:hypothetical protein